MKDFYNNKEIFITGGTGTLGKEITKQLIKNYPEIRGIRVFSRDEEKHRLFKKELGITKKIGFLVGDIRDKDRLFRAMNGVDIIFHTAAMKQIDQCESNPIEAIRTNVDGTVNVIDCAVDNLVQNVMLISTDKACYPVNIYGVTKATAEKLFFHSGVYAPRYTKFSVCRYGNVISSRGSVIPIFQEQYKKDKTLTVTDLSMTRFWIGLKKVAAFVIDRIKDMNGGEIFIPEMRRMSMEGLIEIMFPEKDYTIKDIGIRQGEKIHECLITEEESYFRDGINGNYKNGTVINKKIDTSKIKYALTSANALSWDKNKLKEAIDNVR